jgi:hypothetical protein
MQAFSTCALESDVCIAKDIVDQIIHSGLLKPASSSSFTAEGRRPTDLFCQEVTDVYDEILRKVRGER